MSFAQFFLAILGVIIVIFAMTFGLFTGEFDRIQNDPEFKKRMEELKKEREKQEQAEEEEKQRQQAWKDKWK